MKHETPLMYSKSLFAPGFGWIDLIWANFFVAYIIIILINVFKQNGVLCAKGGKKFFLWQKKAGKKFFPVTEKLVKESLFIYHSFKCINNAGCKHVNKMKRFCSYPKTFVFRTSLIQEEILQQIEKTVCIFFSRICIKQIN